MDATEAVALQRIRGRAAATMRQALEETHLDRELVTRSFNTQLAALNQPPRPVIFYPNLSTAAERVSESRESSWDADWAAARDAAWAAARAAQAIAELSKLRHLATQRYVSPLAFALLYIGLGDKDNAFHALDQAYEERSEYLVYLSTEPLADPLRSDPRFPALLRRLELTVPASSSGAASR